MSEREKRSQRNNWRKCKQEHRRKHNEAATKATTPELLTPEPTPPRQLQENIEQAVPSHQKGREARKISMPVKDDIDRIINDGRKAASPGTRAANLISSRSQAKIKQMMNESKLTNFQQRHLEKSLRGGSSLPVQCAPTSSARPKIQKIPQKQSKIINPKTYKGGVRTKHTMEAQGAFEKPEYILPHKVTRSTREKEKLANIMAFGEDVDKSKKGKVKRVELPEEDEVEIDRFDELKCEVEDRQNFLTDMIKLGRGKEFKTVIDTEISQLVREMEIIDKKRTKELEVLIQKKERENNKLNDS